MERVFDGEADLGTVVHIAAMRHFERFLNYMQVEVRVSWPCLLRLAFDGIFRFVRRVNGSSELVKGCKTATGGRIGTARRIVVRRGKFVRRSRCDAHDDAVHVGSFFGDDLFGGAGMMCLRTAVICANGVKRMRPEGILLRALWGPLASVSRAAVCALLDFEDKATEPMQARNSGRKFNRGWRGYRGWGELIPEAVFWAEINGLPGCRSAKCMHSVNGFRNSRGPPP